mgnify:CR=1 FL=1
MSKVEWNTSPPKQSASIKSPAHLGCSIYIEMITPNSFHDATDVTENVTGFVVSDLLQIDIMAKYAFTPPVLK